MSGSLLRSAAVLLPALLAVACVSGDEAPAPGAGDAARAERAWVLMDVTLLDGIDPRPRPGQAVLVVGERIAGVGPATSLRVPGHARRVDAGGRVLLPGLVDMHTHVTHRGPEALDALLRAGVTGARDMGGDLDALLAWRDEVRRGERPGPELFLCGPFLEGRAAGGTHRLPVDTPEEARAAVDQLAARGVDFLKLQTQLAPDVAAAVLDAARAHGLPVAGHLPMGVDAVTAAELGLASLEHVESLLGLDDAALDDALAALAAHGTALTPTLFGLQEAVRARGADPASDPGVLRAREIVRRAHAAGVTLLAGSNFAYEHWPQQPGSGLHGELAALVDAGLPVADVLRLATHGAARFLGAHERFGAVRPGLRADLLLLDADPLADVRNTRAVHAVVRRGELLRPDPP